MSLQLSIPMAVAMSLAAMAAPAGAQPKAGALSAAEIRAQIVGHSVRNSDGSMTWYYERNGKYSADDGRMGREGAYNVTPDGRLCWKDNTGQGCFQYLRKGKALILKRVDPGHSFDLGPVTIGAL